MTITLTTSPTYARPSARPIPVSITADGSGANFVRLWITGAPEGSSWRRHLDRDALERAEVFANDPAIGFEASFDRGGVYTFVGQEYTLGAAGYGGGYSNDPSRYPTETKVGAEQTLFVYVGTVLEQRIGAPEYGLAKLRLWVWDDTIRATSIAQHGEVTPAIVQPQGARAANAAKASSVQTALATLADTSVADARAGLDALHQELRSRIVAHLTQEGVHEANDSDNGAEITALPTAPTTAAGFAFCAEVLSRRLDLHMRSDTYHLFPDWKNALVAARPPGASDMASTWLTYADLVRAFAAHREDTAAHSLADTTNTIETALPPLLEVYRTYLDTLRVLAPTAPGEANSGASDLIHSAGFIEATP